MKIFYASLLPFSFAFLFLTPALWAGESVAFSMEQDTIPTWIDLEEDTNYTARHECSFVQAGETFILFGGRENSDIPEIYDYKANSWQEGARAPEEFNHFQAITYDGFVWVIGSFKDNRFPNEAPADSIYIYDPLADVWLSGPEIPSARRRGSAGLVLYQGKFYVVGGNTIGHNGGFIPWFDAFDPTTGTWETLEDAPNARDHFHAVVYDDKLYAIGGRLSGDDVFEAPLVPKVDIYDFDSQSWSSLPDSLNLPTERAAPGMAVFQDEILVMGGETKRGINFDRAYDIVEAFDPATQRWSNKEPMTFGRHGFQAIVSGDGIYVTAGSPKRGGENQRNMEVYNANNPSGTAITAGQLGVPNLVEVSLDADSFSVPIAHTGGNQGILIESIQITGTDSDSFVFLGNLEPWVFLPAGQTLNLPVSFLGNQANRSATMEISYYGSNTPATITLESVDTPPPPFTTAVSGFRLLNAENDEIIDTLTNLMEFRQDLLPEKIKLEAVLDQAAGSVTFQIEGPITSTETDSTAPFTLFGATGETLAVGSYTLEATPWSENTGEGTMGQADSLQFTILAPPDFSTGVAHFILLDGNAQTELDSLNNLDTLNQNELPSLLNIKAVLDGEAGSVVFELTGPFNQTTFDSLNPFLLFQGQGSTFPAGTYQLKATPKSESDGTGLEGAADSLQFTMANLLPPPFNTKIVGYQLIDSDGMTVLDTLTDQDQLNNSELPERFDIRAITDQPAGSVVFILSGDTNLFRTDSTFEYELFGKENGGGSLAPGTYLLFANPWSSANGSGTSGEGLSIGFEIKKDTPTSISSPSLDEVFRIWPNPASEDLHVELAPSLKDADLDLIDVQGRTVKSLRKLAGGMVRMEISDIPNGTYFIQLRYGERKLIRTFSKR